MQKMARNDNVPQIRFEHEYRGIKYPNNVLDSSIDRIKTFQVREDDIWIVTYPKAGTHWMMEIVGLIVNDGDPDQINRTLYSSTAEMICMDQNFPTSKGGRKVVYVARNPKDIIVSWFNFVGKNPALPLTMDKAIKDLVSGGNQLLLYTL
eukprot:XP_011674435.1 PREDICTED: sulfotransferase family cytosolic 2B member 1-like [Strongylocentrotus purpuratus]